MCPARERCGRRLFLGLPSDPSIPLFGSDVNPKEKYHVLGALSFGRRVESSWENCGAAIWKKIEAKTGCKKALRGGPLMFEFDQERGSRCGAYLGGAGVNPSRLRPGSGLGLGFGAFLTSFLPLSLLPMGRSVTQKGRGAKGRRQWRSRCARQVSAPRATNQGALNSGDARSAFATSPAMSSCTISRSLNGRSYVSDHTT